MVHFSWKFRFVNTTNAIIKFFKNKGYNFTVACSPSEDFFTYSKEMDFIQFP